MKHCKKNIWVGDTKRVGVLYNYSCKAFHVLYWTNNNICHIYVYLYRHIIFVCYNYRDSIWWCTGESNCVHWQLRLHLPLLCPSNGSHRPIRPGDDFQIICYVPGCRSSGQKLVTFDRKSSRVAWTMSTVQWCSRYLVFQCSIIEHIIVVHQREGSGLKCFQCLMLSSFLKYVTYQIRICSKE